MIEEDCWILHIFLGLGVQIHEIPLRRPVCLVDLLKLSLCFRVLPNPKHDLISRSPDGIQFCIFELRVEIYLKSGNLLNSLNKINQMQLELLDGLQLIIGCNLDALCEMFGSVLEIKIVALDECAVFEVIGMPALCKVYGGFVVG